MATNISTGEWEPNWLFTRGPGDDFVVAQSNGERFRLHLAPDVIIPFDSDTRAQVFYGSAIHEHQTGRVTYGRTVDARIEFTIQWDDGKSGEYSGFVHADGRLRGVSREIGGPGVADWWNHDNVAWGPPDEWSFAHFKW